MKKIALTFYISTICIFTSFAQAGIKFDLESFDFGELVEGEMAVHEFTFTNTGKEPLIIANVQPSCGCTTPEWSKEPVMPGQKGKMKAMFNTSGRPGFFNKSINVTSNSATPSVTIFIKGSVIKTSEKKYTDVELKTSPKLVLEKTEHNFGRVEKGTKLAVKINVKNMGRSDLRILEAVSACQCVTFMSKNDYIKSGESDVIELIYNAYNLGDSKDNVYIKSNDITNPSQKFVLSVKVVESINNNSLLKESTNIPFK